MKKRESIFPIRILITTDAIHLAKLKELAKSTNTSVSEVIRDLVDGKLQPNQNKQ